MSTPFMIRLEIDQMRHAIVHAFSLNSAEVQKALDEGLKKALEFDFEAVVKAEAERAMREAVAKTAARAVDSVMCSEEMDALLGPIMRKLAAIAEALKTEAGL